MKFLYCNSLINRYIIDNIVSCDIIISSSLHGVILGIAYKKKVIFTQFKKLSLYKYHDFLSSINVNNYDILLSDNGKLFNNYIDYKNIDILLLGIDMITSYPFINIERKKELIDNWKKYWN